jgi:hypothetical protein
MAVHRIDYKHFPTNMYEKMDESFFVWIKIIYYLKKKLEIFSLTFNGRASSGPLPYRCDGFFFNNFLIKSLASLVRYGGTKSLAETILSIVFLRFSAVNGGYKIQKKFKI